MVWSVSVAHYNLPFCLLLPTLDAHMRRHVTCSLFLNDLPWRKDGCSGPSCSSHLISLPLHLLSAQWPQGIWFGLAADKRDVSICGTEQTHLSSCSSLLSSLCFPFLCINFTFQVPSSPLHPSTDVLCFPFQASFLLLCFFCARLSFTYLSWSSFLYPFFSSHSLFLLPTPFFSLLPISSLSFAAGYN